VTDPPDELEFRCPRTLTLIAAERCVQWQREFGCSCWLAATESQVAEQRAAANKGPPCRLARDREELHARILDAVDKLGKPSLVATELRVSVRTVQRVHLAARGEPVEPRIGELPMCPRCEATRIRAAGEMYCSDCRLGIRRRAKRPWRVIGF
jgi:hypothetical protein